MFHEFWWLLPVLMIALCLFMMRGSMCGMGPHRRGRHIGPSDSAQDILEKRYARGDIGKEEYDEKKRVLTGQEKILNREV